ncbi:MAG TPA: sigma-E factor negative regulatory protein [Acidiferrobacterales bacterium]|jgi:negative regulator of sigma E activity
MKEKVSELLDDELADGEHHEVLRRISDDRDLRGAWERYHIMRAALRKELDILVGSDLAERVASGIDADPVGGRGAAIRRLPLPRVTRYAAGLALAASVAAVALFNLKPLTTDGTAPLDIAAQSKAAPNVAVVGHKGAKGPLNTFLVEHSEIAPTGGMTGMTPYVRVVGYSNEQ